MEEKKHVCKHCNKRFSCGKSLGGHIRIHMMNEHYSVNANDEKNNAAAMLKRKRDLGSCGIGEDGNFNYGLRENPKKTIRFVHSKVNANNNNSQMENFCKECGKGFTSLKALCGHMACHSEKDKGRFENNSDSVITEKQKHVVDSNSSSSESDTETSLPMKSRRRSKRMKFKILSNNNNIYKSLSLLKGSCSSSVSEVDNEKEEGAKCLMLLSNDKRPFTLVIDSSDNNSVIVDEKSPSPSKKPKHKDVKYYDSDDYDYDSDNSDSGYFLYGPNKLDSADEVNSSKGYLEYLDNDSRKRLRLKNDFLTQTLVPASKKAKNGENNEHDDLAYESDEDSTDSDSYPAAKTQNNNNSCKNLNGKAKKCNKKGKKKLKSKKSKEHECPICNKMFKSGQALGGHKRSHFIGGYYEENNTLVIRPNPPPPAPPASAAPAALAPICLIDLNLPAPDDE